MNAVALMEFLFLFFFKLVPSDLRMNRINFHVLHTAQQGFSNALLIPGIQAIGLQLVKLYIKKDDWSQQNSYNEF